MFFRFLSFISIIFLLSCNNKEELIEIVSINDHGDLTYKLSKQKSIIYYRTYSFIDDGTVDSLGIDLSESDWRRINASFFKNEINKLDNNENYIGVETNSIKFPEKYTLKTNSKILNLKYDYFWKNDVSKINKLKTQKLVNFLITCDSIIAEKKNKLKHTDSNNFFLMAGPCAIEGEDIALRIAEKIVTITDKLNIPYIFKGSYRKANRSKGSSFTGIGDEKALKILEKVGKEFGVPTVTDIHESAEAAMAAAYVDVLQIPAFLCRQTDLVVAAAQTGRSVSWDGMCSAHLYRRRHPECSDSAPGQLKQ